MSEIIHTVGIIGAGTMGAGIAQVATRSGWTVELMDVDADVVGKAIEGIKKRIDRLVEKGRMTSEQGEEASSRLLIATTPDSFKDCELIIEAIVEDIDIKANVLRDIVPALREDAIIATNTSSLSVSKIANAIGNPFGERTLGMHFFNPAPVMKLCEVIAGNKTDPAVVDRIAAIAESWGKKVARAADVPGFIVNHVARPYYLEAFRILEDGFAPPETIDQAMKELGGFRMGPLELTDLIGQDINTATTRSVWEQLGKPPLLAPNPLQESLVANGHLGRKSGRGVYDYTGDSPIASIPFSEKPLEMSDDLREAVNQFTAHAVNSPGSDPQNYIFARILGGLVVQATLAHARGVAEKTDIDTALKYGVNYPQGPFQWAEQIGHQHVARLLEALHRQLDDERFELKTSLGNLA